MVFSIVNLAMRRYSFTFSQRFISTTTSTATELNYEPDTIIASFKSLACPVCLQPFSDGSFTCTGCRKVYRRSPHGVIDLTIPRASVPFSASVFENKHVARIYDRSYRESFQRWGFPGFKEEFKMAHEILRPCHGKTIMDLSCAGGTSTRSFLTSNAYEFVVAADYSEPMLEQCYELLKSDPDIDFSKLVLVKADAGRLPFTGSSFAAVHSAAAIHCWTNPLYAVAEIVRLLQPGGIFVASTFLVPGVNTLVKPVKQLLAAVQPLPLWTESELREIVEACGLVNWKCIRNKAFILFWASKPL